MSHRSVAAARAGVAVDPARTIALASGIESSEGRTHDRREGTRRTGARALKFVRAKSGEFDEIFEPSGAVRPHYRPLLSVLETCTREDLERRERLQKLSL
ncbi:MAG: hypothetical protein L0206_19200, partial [Actinobacteria bacterium]|nr:hypothetical protein [Actinomycetota bacterium]